MQMNFVLAISLISCVTPSLVRAQNTQCLFAKYGPATVSVEYRYETEDSADEGGNGTGFIVSSTGYVLTDAHVVTPKETATKIKNSSIKVRVGGLRSTPLLATLAPADIDKSTDVALIKLPDIGVAWPVVPVSYVKTLPIGAALTGLGFAGQSDLALVPTAGKTAESTVVDGRRKPWWQTSLNLFKGNSGGPIFGALGTAVGIAVALDQSNVHTTYVIPIVRAKQLLDKANVQSAPFGDCADFPVCRHPSHGIERYEVNELVGDESEWRYGGGNPNANQDSWCTDYLAQLQQTYPASNFTKTTSREREDWDNAALRIGRKYKYYCEYRRLERPVYKSEKSAVCLK